MNIAFISYWSCPLTRLGVLSAGGMNVYVLNLANNLGLLGHKVDIYTQAHKENDEEIIKTHGNVRVIHLSSKKDDLYNEAQVFSRKIIAFVDKHSLKYDVLHGHYFYSGLVGLDLASKLSLPIFITFHALGITKELYVGVKDDKRIATEKKIVASADGIISSVELEREELVRNYNADRNKIYVVPPGVNHHLFRKMDKRAARKKVGLYGREKIILFVGRIDPIKGISLLIDAVYKLSQNRQNFKNNFKIILIGGDIESRNFWKHPEVIKIQSLIEKLDLTCCVKFIGAKPHNVLPYYYNAADLVVMPSKYESFGLVVLEAMASGACVVASQVGGLSYLLKDKINGRLFKSGDSTRLSEVIWELLNDDIQREVLGKAATLASQKFCWDIQAEKILEIYKKFIR